MTDEFHVEDYKDECKVIVVDSSDFSRKKLVNILESQRINIVGEASTCGEAMKLINKTGANIIISEIIMPDLSGIELAKKFNDGFSEKYFIFISSLTRERSIIEAITAGAVDFIEKPYNEEVLQQSVLKVCMRVAEGLG